MCQSILSIINRAKPKGILKLHQVEPTMKNLQWEFQLKIKPHWSQIS